jgi:hypothetical protein
VSEAATKTPILRAVLQRIKPSDGLEPSTPSLPWRFRGVTRVHARSLAAQFLLQIELSGRLRMRRETSRVSFLMCPFCVRGLLSNETTGLKTTSTDDLDVVDHAVLDVVDRDA